MEFIANVEEIALERMSVACFTKIAGREVKMNVHTNKIVKYQ